MRYSYPGHWQKFKNLTLSRKGELSFADAWSMIGTILRERNLTVSSAAEDA